MDNELLQSALQIQHNNMINIKKNENLFPTYKYTKKNGR